MSAKPARPTDEDLLAQFEGLGEEDGGAPKNPKPAPPASDAPDAELFPELAIPERQRPTSRPHTPRLASSTTTTQSSKASPRRTGINTPPSNDGARSSEEKAPPRKSGESSRSFHTSFTPATDNEVEPEPEKRPIAPPATQAQSSGGGWWGGIFATASAAVKQAEALAKEIQHNEEAQRWAEQVKGNVGALRGFGKQIPLHVSHRIPVVYASVFQAASCVRVLSRPSRTSFILSHHLSPRMNDSRSISLMISSATPPSTPLSTIPSPA